MRAFGGAKKENAVLANLAVASLLSVSPLGTTWIVDPNGNGDFTDIQSAIRAASDGDIVMVNPGSYDGFDLRERITVKASAAPFEIRSPIEISDVQAGAGAAVVSGVTVDPYYDDEFIRVEECDGEVVLEDCWYAASYRRAAFTITDALHVTLVNCGTSGFSADDAMDVADLVQIRRSIVAASSLVLEGGTGGFTAMYVEDSSVTLAASTIHGGKGSSGMKLFDQMLIDPGDGGPGVAAYRSDLLVLGDELATIVGGDGGCTVDLEWSNSCLDPYGAGGVGVALDDCDFVVSRCVVRGGEGSRNGAEHSGETFTRDDSYPFMTLDPALRIGKRTSLTLDAVQTGSAILLLSDQGGSTNAGPKWSGPPLAVLSGLIFTVADLGLTDGAGDWSGRLHVPDDPALVGLTYHTQIAFFADTGAYFLTNSVVRAVGN